jgi:DNA-directed RNA polymerase specialized sigma24 family protein
MNAQGYLRAAQFLRGVSYRTAEIFRLRFVEGHSDTEVSEALALSERTVRIHLARAQFLLRRFNPPPADAAEITAGPPLKPMPPLVSRSA